MIDDLLAILADARLQLSPPELRDALWLSEHVTAPALATPLSRSTLHRTVERERERAEPADHDPTTARSDVVPTSPAPSRPTAAGRADLFPAGAATSSTAVRASVVRSPAVPALRQRADIVRALRPFKRRVSSFLEAEVDEDATAERIAADDLWLPVLRPTPARWLGLTLVIDSAPSMVVWQRTIAEFRSLAEQLGAFRHVRVVGVDGAASDSVRMTAFATPHTTATDRRRPPADPAIVLDPTGRQVTLVVTDAVGAAWRNGLMLETLRTWARVGPTAVATVLPRRMWAGSGLTTRSTRLRGPRPGSANADLASLTPLDAVPVPVLALSGQQLGMWARLVCNAGDWTTTSVLTPARPARRRGRPIGPELDAAELVARFRGFASPTAFRLACYFAATALTLPVMRLIQQVMLPESDTAHLAEVFLSGLLRRLGAGPSDGPDTVQYEFAPGVRDELISFLLRRELIEVVERSTEFVSSRLGQPLDFAALVADPDGVELPVILGPDSERTPFAQVAIQSLSRLGGRYAELANRIGQGSAEPAHSSDETFEPAAFASHIGGTPSDRRPIDYFLAIRVRSPEQRMNPTAPSPRDIPHLEALFQHGAGQRVIADPVVRTLLEYVAELPESIAPGGNLLVYVDCPLGAEPSGVAMLVPRRDGGAWSHEPLPLERFYEALTKSGAAQILVLQAAPETGPEIHSVADGTRTAARWVSDEPGRWFGVLGVTRASPDGDSNAVWDLDQLATVLGSLLQDGPVTADQLCSRVQRTGTPADDLRPYYSSTPPIDRPMFYSRPIADSGPDDPDAADDAVSTSAEDDAPVPASSDEVARQRRVLAEAEQRWGPSARRTLHERIRLLDVQGRSGDIAAAVGGFEQLVAEQTEARSRDHMDTLRSRARLAYWLGRLGETGAAATEWEQLVDAQTRVLGPDHVNTLSSRASRAYWLDQLREHERALAEYQLVLADRERVLGGAHVDTARTVARIGFVQQHMGDHAAAASTFTAAVDALGRALGVDHPETAAAAEALRVSAQTHQPAVGSDAMTPMASVELGLLRGSQGDLDAAARAFTDAIESGHPDQAPRAAFNLGSLRQDQGDLDAALATYQLAIDSGHADMAPRAAFNLGVLRRAAGDLNAAAAAFQQAIESGHADIAPRAAVGLGVLRQDQGDLDAAAAAFQQAIESGHADMAPRAAFDLALLREQEGAKDIAVRLYELAGTLDPAFANAHANLARLLYASGRDADAERQADWALRLADASPATRAECCFLLFAHSIVHRRSAGAELKQLVGNGIRVANASLEPTLRRLSSGRDNRLGLLSAVAEALRSPGVSDLEKYPEWRDLPT